MRHSPLRFHGSNQRKDEAMTPEEYAVELKHRIDAVFKKHPEIPDHRQQLPWVTGFLGNPFSGIWFMAENPSRGTANPGVFHMAEAPTEESQWRISSGDVLFRQMLVKHGFKQPPWDAPGGWSCYITDAVKQAEDAGVWQKQSTSHRNQVAEIWSEVLSWELETSKPVLVVAMGRKVGNLLIHLSKARGLRLPVLSHVEHYSYVAMRPCGKLPPMDPSRVTEYDNQMREVAAQFGALRRA